MNTYIIIFCVIAAVFAVATLFYVGGSVAVQAKSKKNKPRSVAPREETSSRSCGLLLLGSMIGTVGGVLVACIAANPRECEKKKSKKKL